MGKGCGELMLQCTGRARTHTHTHTQTWCVYTCLFSGMCALSWVCQESRETGKADGFTFLGQGLKGLHFQVCRVGEAEIVKYSGS